MNRRKLIKMLESAGWKLHSHGANHDIYSKGSKKESIPRHRDINENLAKPIIKRQGLK